MADIISFPSDRLLGAPQPSPSAPVRPDDNPVQRRSGLQMPSMDGSVARAIAICNTSEPAPLSALPDSAWVIGTALRWINRRGKRRSAVPKLVLGLLDRHVSAGDPAAKMFARWLDGDAPQRWSTHDLNHCTISGVATENEINDAAGEGE
jgi:hypothetical protein